MANLLSIYHKLPYPSRVVAASIKGYFLRSWRYGPETERLVEEALERESWSGRQWRTWQEERLAYVLHRAATEVPYYRAYWANRSRRGDRASWELLEHWPVLKKEAVRSKPEAFIAADCDIRKMYRDNTSGTTGTPLTIYWMRSTLRQWFALFEARVRNWHHLSIRDRWAIMGGQLVAPFKQKHPPFWVRNIALNQLYLSTHHISSKNARHYLQALREFAPTHMIVYPSSATVLARAMLEQKLEAPKLTAVFSNAEQLLDSQRQVMEEAFRCPVYDTYGMGEAVAGASECEAKTMHLWPEVGLIEVLSDTEDVALDAGESGRLIVTGLLNSDMPLIRYQTGDRGRLNAATLSCACGRPLPSIDAIEGRLDDMVLTPEGRRIFWLNPAFYGLPIQEAQVIQESLHQLRVRFVPTSHYTQQTGQTIINRLQERVGALEIVLEPVESIPRTANGKFRAVVSKLSKERVVSSDNDSGVEY